MPNPLLQTKTSPAAPAKPKDVRADLLRRAADELQEMWADDDMNSSLAMEIYKELENDGKTAEQDEPAQLAPALLPQDQQDSPFDPHSQVGQDEAHMVNSLGITNTASKEAHLARKLAAYMNGYATAAEEYLKKFGTNMKHADAFAKKRGFRPKYFREAIQTMSRYASIKKEKTSGAPMTNQGYGKGTVCPKCSQPIAEGAMVDWTGGVEQHAGACPPTGAQQPGSRIMFPKGQQPKQPQMAGKMDMTVVEEDGYVKVKHPRYGTVCAGIKGPDGQVHHIEFLDPRYQKNNMIRMPAMAKLKQWEWSQSQKQASSKVAFDPQLATLVGSWVALLLAKWAGTKWKEKFSQLDSSLSAKAQSILAKQGITDMPTLDAYAQENGGNRYKALGKIALQQLALAAAVTLGVSAANLFKATPAEAAAPQKQEQVTPTHPERTDMYIEPMEQAEAAPAQPTKQQIRQQEKQRIQQQMEQLKQQDADNPGRQQNIT